MSGRERSASIVALPSLSSSMDAGPFCDQRVRAERRRIRAQGQPASNSGASSTQLNHGCDPMLNALGAVSGVDDARLRSLPARAETMRPDTYKAAIYRGAGSVEVLDLPYPRCGHDEVIVKNLMTGVCGSDVSAYKRGGD